MFVAVLSVPVSHEHSDYCPPSLRHVLLERVPTSPHVASVEQYRAVTEMVSMWRLYLLGRVSGHPLGPTLIGAAIYLSTL